MAGTNPAVNLLVSLCLDSKRYLWFQIEDSSPAGLVVCGWPQCRPGTTRSSRAQGSPSRKRGPLRQAAMETYKYFSHLSQKDLVIWQVWSQNLPEVCIKCSPGVKEGRPSAN